MKGVKNKQNAIGSKLSYICSNLKIKNTKEKKQRVNHGLGLDKTEI